MRRRTMSPRAHAMTPSVTMPYREQVFYESTRFITYTGVVRFTAIDKKERIRLNERRFPFSRALATFITTWVKRYAYDDENYRWR